VIVLRIIILIGSDEKDKRADCASSTTIKEINNCVKNMLKLSNNVKGAVNPNILNLTKNRENF